MGEQSAWTVDERRVENGMVMPFSSRTAHGGSPRCVEPARGLRGPRQARWLPVGWKRGTLDFRV
eukprot:489537-Prymnesium_polylepis.1